MGVLERLRAAVSAFRCATPPSADDELLDLRRDVAAARLELQETQAALERERARVRSLEAGRAEAVREGTEARVEQLLQALAAPLSQLRTQGYLLREDKPVQVTDVLAVIEGRKPEYAVPPPA